MLSITQPFEPRDYQKKILDLTKTSILDGNNVIIELDCGLGKRFLQYALITEVFQTSNIILLLQASTSLYETANYLKKYLKNGTISVIDSRISSKIRAEILTKSRIVLSLPQTLSNTLKAYPDAAAKVEVVVINEVDQIVKRMGTSTTLKHPYPKLIQHFQEKHIIGMSGTIRDYHYILDKDQLKIRKELESMLHVIKKAKLVTMGMIDDSDVQKYIIKSDVIPTEVPDHRMEEISVELNAFIEEAKKQVLAIIEEEDPVLFQTIQTDKSKLFGPLPVPPSIASKFQKGYMVRKYLWAMPGESAKWHLIGYGLDKALVESKLPLVPAKFFAIKDLVQKYSKSVILCSYLDTVDVLCKLIQGSGMQTIKVTGSIPQHQRASSLDNFRSSPDPIVAVLSNVGERDLDIPEAELLIIFDLVRTTKTVYQKLKRSRGGECRILYYQNTDEERKVHSVLRNLKENYPWSTEVLSKEIIST